VRRRHRGVPSPVGQIEWVTGRPQLVEKLAPTWLSCLVSFTWSLPFLHTQLESAVEQTDSVVLVCQKEVADWDARDIVCFDDGTQSTVTPPVYLLFPVRWFLPSCVRALPYLHLAFKA
jgi:hypothetical protein